MLEEQPHAALAIGEVREDRAREKARMTACLSNLKQLGIGWMMYVQDYDERFPKCYTRVNGVGTIRYRAELDHGMIEHELVHMFRGLYDGTIAPNPAEAEGYQWARLEDVRADVAVMPQRFSAWFREYIAAQWPMALAAPAKTPHSQG